MRMNTNTMKRLLALLLAVLLLQSSLFALPVQADGKIIYDVVTPSEAAPALHSLSAERSCVLPGDVIRWTFAAENVQDLTFEIKNAAGETVHSGDASSMAVEYTAGEPGEYTLHVAASAGGRTESLTSTVTVAAGAVAVSMNTGLLYAAAGETAVDYLLEITGGAAPYAVQVQIMLDGQIVHEQHGEADAEGNYAVSYMPAAFGVHSVRAVVTDAAGMQASAAAEMPVAVREEETAADWEKSVQGAAVTGNWSRDLVSAAKTQIGYKESEKNFEIDENGNVSGYTRYGAWQGRPFADWNSLFVSFCLHYANIPQHCYPRGNNAAGWADDLARMGAYRSADSGYVPAAGDMIFLDMQRDGRADRVGIVSDVSESIVRVIEGDRDGAVAQEKYEIGDAKIAGYGSTYALMARAGFAAEPTAEPTPEPTSEPTAEPDIEPTSEPTAEPAAEPTAEPTAEAMTDPISEPTAEPAIEPDAEPAGGFAADDQGGEMCSCGLPEGHAGECAILEHPEDYAGAIGDVAVFTVEAMDGASYQWQRRRADAGEDAWEDITDDRIAQGWNTAELRVVITQESAAYLYRCGVILPAHAAQASSVLSALFPIGVAYADGSGTIVYSAPAGVLLTSGATGYLDISVPNSTIHVNGSGYSVDGETSSSSSDGILTVSGTSEKSLTVILGETGAENEPIPVILEEVCAANAGVRASAGRTAGLTVQAESAIGSITVEAGARLTLTVNADLTVGAIALEDGADIEIVIANGCTLTADMITGGNMILSGGALHAGQISCGTVRISGAAVSAQGGIVAAESMQICDSVIESTAKIGIDAASGLHAMVLDNTQINPLGIETTVGALGAGRVALQVTNAKQNSGAIEYIGDYEIDYRAGGAEIMPEGAADAYRVSMTDAQVYAGAAQGTIIGRYGESGEYSPCADGTIAYPKMEDIPAENRTEFYRLAGWTFGNADEIGDVQAYVSPAFSGISGDLTVTAVFAPLPVEVILHMNNDGAPQESAAITQDADGNTIYYDMPFDLYGMNMAPFVFGYTFTAWTNTPLLPSGEKKDAEFAGEICYYGTETDEYFTADAAGDVRLNAAGDGCTVDLYAYWSPINVEVVFSLGDNSPVPTDAAMIRFADEGEFEPYTDEVFEANGYTSVSPIAIKYTRKIAYGENLAGALGGYFPALSDSRELTDDVQAMDFLSWKLGTEDRYVTPDTTMTVCSAENPHGLFDLTGMTQEQIIAYQKLLETSAVVLYADWTTRSLSIDVGNMADAAAKGWKVYIGEQGDLLMTDITEQAKEGPVVVRSTQVVTFVRPENDPSQTMAFWEVFEYANAADLAYAAGWHAETAENAVWPEENAGKENYYSFTVGSKSIFARFTPEREWLTDAGDYSFGSVAPSGNSESLGFTLTKGEKVITLRWPKTQFSFTSLSPTAHQIKVDRAFTLDLNGVLLSAREGAADRLNTAAEAFYYKATGSDYGNIIAENVNTNELRGTLTLNMKGTSSVYLIEQTHRNNSTASIYRTTLNMTGTGGASLKTSAVIWEGGCNIKNMTITDAEDAAGFFVLYKNTPGEGSTAGVSGTTIRSSRNIYSEHGGTKAASSNGGAIYYTNSTIELGGALYGGLLHINKCNIAVSALYSTQYEFNFTNGTAVRAGFVGLHNAPNYPYPHLVNTVISASTVEIVPEMLEGDPQQLRSGFACGTLEISKGARLITDNLYLAGYMTVTGAGTVVRADVLKGFERALDGTETHGALYSDNQPSNHFYMTVSGGADVHFGKVLMRSHKGDTTADNTLGLMPGGAESDVPHITVDNASLTFGESVRIINRVLVVNGGVLELASSDGDAYLATTKDLLVDSSSTIIAGRILHTCAQTVTESDGLQRYHTMTFEDGASVMGSDGGEVSLVGAGEGGLVDVIMNRESENISVATVERDLMIRYTLPYGFEANNPVRLRLKDDALTMFDDEAGNTYAMKAPADTAGQEIIITAENWYYGENNIRTLGENALLGAGDALIAGYAGLTGAITLEARAENGILSLVRDEDAIVKIEYKKENQEAWTELALEAGKDAYIVPVGASVRVTLKSEYAQNNYGFAMLVSVVNGKYQYNSVAYTAEGDSYTFSMDAANMRMYAVREMALYMDEDPAAVGKFGGEWGFWLFEEYDRPENFFRYGGNFHVTQRDSSLNMAYGFCLKEDNTLSQAHQQVRISGLNVAANEKFDTIVLEKNARIRFEGENTVRNVKFGARQNIWIDADEDAVIRFKHSSEWTHTYLTMIGTDACTGSNLVMTGGSYITTYTATSLKSNSRAMIGKSLASVVLDNVDLLSGGGTYSGSRVIHSAGSIEIRNGCLIKTNFYEQGTIYAKTVTISDSEVWLGSASGSINYKSTSAVNGSGTTALTVRDGAKVYFAPTSGQAYFAPGTVGALVKTDLALNVEGEGTELYLGYDTVVKSITVGSGATLNAMTPDGSNAFFIAAANISISGTVNAASIFTSGYATKEAHDLYSLRDLYHSNSIASGGTINIWGTVSLRMGEFYPAEGSDRIEETVIGGSRGSVINIYGGNVQADVIGSIGYAVAATQGSGDARRTSAYVQDEKAVPACVNIYGGKVSAFRLISGKEILISGGVIDGGEINAGSGTIDISAGSVQVETMYADGGSITITTQDRGIHATVFNGDEMDHVGVYVKDELLARNITIKDGARVSAKNAISYTAQGTVGKFTVSGGDTRLYTQSYGADGYGSVDFDLQSGAVTGVQANIITYALLAQDDPYQDDIVLNDHNPTNFSYDAAGSIYLDAAVREGYEFVGWFDAQGTEFMKDEQSGRWYFSANLQDPIQTYAKWRPVEVEFRVYSGGVHVAGDAGTVRIPYRALIMDTIDLNDYATDTKFCATMFNDVNSDQLSQDDIVGIDMVRAYLARLADDDGQNDFVRLTTDMYESSKLVELHLNKVGAAYPDGVVAALAYVNINKPFGTAYFSQIWQNMGVKGLPSPAATGYSFMGWFDQTGETEYTDDTPALSGVDRYDLYAKWEPNTYDLTFDAGEGGVVTLFGAQPDADSGQTMTGKVRYDAQIDGSLQFGELDGQRLPAAWKKGKVFIGWRLRDDARETIGSSTIMRWTHDENGSIPLEAVYEDIRISYDLNGGKWAEGNSAENWQWSEDGALPGYNRSGNEGGYSYAVSSAGGKGAEGDYRNVLGMTGYTFCGWQDADGVIHAQMPDYDHLELRAVWKANRYTVRIHSLDAGNGEYGLPGMTITGDSAAPITGIEVETGKPIESDLWPERTYWECENRLLLGATFDRYNATASDYAALITELIRKHLVFGSGSVFILPDGGTDYPDGTEIDMYAVYREISLVFVNTMTGEEAGAYRWDEYAQPPVLEAVDGFALADWRINDPKGDIVYSRATYPDNADAQGNVVNDADGNGTNDTLDAYKKVAADSRVYDIRVYANFVPQHEEGLRVLVASAGKYREAGNASAIYTLPQSMKSGQIWYEIEAPDGVAFISSADIADAVHSETVMGGTPADTFALVMDTTLASGNTQQEYDGDLLLQEGRCRTGKYLGGSDQVRITLVHANRIAQNKTYDIRIHFYWQASEDAAEQIWTLPVRIQTKQPAYDLIFNSNLPSDRGEPLIDAEGRWTVDAQGNIVPWIEQSYGAPLTAPDAQTAEGYRLDGWYGGRECAGDRITAMTLYDDDREIAGTVYAKWTVLAYELSADAEVPERWAVEYSDGYAADEASVPADMASLGENSVQVTYRGTVKLTPRAGGDYEYPEFITDGAGWSLLEEQTAADGSWHWFRMPAEDRGLVYSRVKTLDISEGSIVIDPDGYTIGGGEKIIWRGDYIITGETNDNTLTVNGLAQKNSSEMASLTLADGLKIMADDSVSVYTALEMAVEGTAALKNISVPANASLTLCGNGTGKLYIEPSAGRAGIGHADGNGPITINGTDIDLQMPGASSASGIGSSADAASGGPIAIYGSSVELGVDVVIVGSPYQGTLIGGSGIAEVTLSSTDMSTKTDASQLNISAVGAENIRIENGCNIVLDKYMLRASDSIGLSGGSALELNANFHDGVSIVRCIGAEEIIVQGGSRLCSNGYMGKMLIMAADADVMMDAGRLLEIANGDITLDEDQSTQGSAVLESAGREYVLISERGSEGSAKANVTGACTLSVGTDVSMAEISVENTALTLKGEGGHLLTLSGGIKGSGEMVLQDVQIEADGNVGLDGGSVYLIGSNAISAPVIGATGSDGFTQVTLAVNAELHYTGTLVRDWYWVEYDAPAGFAPGAGSPDRLRTEESGSGAVAVQNDSEKTTRVPAAEPAGGFDYWYIADGSAQIRLGGEKRDMLSTDLCAYAADYAADGAHPGDPMIRLSMEPACLRLESAENIVLTAYEPAHIPGSGETKQYVFDFADENAGDSRGLLKSRTLYIRSIEFEPDAAGEAFSGDTYASLSAMAETAGSNYANSTFAVTAQLDGGAEVDTHKPVGGNAAVNAGQRVGTITEESRLTVSLHNANAITSALPAGKVTLVLTTSADPDMAYPQTDEIRIVFTVGRVPSQLKATVPLVIVMQTNIDGGCMTSGDMEEYCIDNDSSMSIRLTDAVEVRAADAQNPLTPDGTSADIGTMVDKYRITLKAGYKDAVLAADGAANDADKFNPLDKIEVSRLSFVTEADKGVHFSTITYTVQIPETGAEADN